MPVIIPLLLPSTHLSTSSSVDSAFLQDPIPDTIKITTLAVVIVHTGNCVTVSHKLQCFLATHMEVGRIQILAHYWTEASVPCDLLTRGSVGSLTQSKTGCFIQEEVAVSCNLTMDVACHHRGCILLVRSKALAKPTLQGRGLHTRRWG